MRKEGIETMHNIIMGVFKVIMVSMIMMLTLHATTVVMDTLNVRSRVQDVETILKYELAKHNAVTDELGALLDRKLQDIVDNSNVATQYRWNWQNSITTYGKTYPAINEANVRDYGEEIEYLIQLDMRVPLFIYGQNPNEPITPEGDEFQIEPEGIIYVDTYSDVVPALRYLK